MAKLKTASFIAERFVVPDLLQNDDIRVCCADIRGHQLHSLVEPVETRISGDEPGCGHGVPGVVGNDSKARMLHREANEGEYERHHSGESRDGGNEGDIA